MHFKKLEWDSDFFGFNVARIDDETNIESYPKIFEELLLENIKLGYYSSLVPLSINSDLYEIKLVDKKTTYIKKIDQTKPQDGVIAYNREYPEETLLVLAVRSGNYSRFNVDNNIDKAQFERLYRQWMVQSVNKKMADEVFVHYEAAIVTGFVTIGSKNNRADIGIIAVDESFSRRGIGVALMKTAEHYAAQKFKVVQVVTQGDNLAACKLYEHCGYSVEKVEYFYHLWKKEFSQAL